MYSTYRRKLFDPWVLLSVCSLLGLGIVMIASASIAFAQSRGHSGFYFVYMQCMGIVIGIATAYVITYIPMKFWYKSGYIWLIITIVALISLLIPGVTRSINGSTRWLFIGPVSVQISEFAKIGALIYLSGYIVRKEQEIIETFWGFLKPLFVVALLALLLLLQPDFGTVAILTGTAMLMLFLAQVKISRFAILAVAASVLLTLIAVASPYRLQRLTSFLDPWADQFGSGYQLTQSLIAIGSGGIFGKGLGNSTQKLFYLPEAHTDFIFAILAEELGLIWVLVVMALFGILIYRAIMIAQRAMNANLAFAAYLGYGIALSLGLQIIINLGVNTGLLPTKGLTLPFLSYGCSSIVAVLISIGLLFRIDLETRTKC